MTEPDVPALAAQIACRLLGDYAPEDRNADDQIARRAVRLARLLIAEVARTEEPKPMREAGRSCLFEAREDREVLNEVDSTMTTNAIDEGLTPLFDQAERDGLWFFCAYQQLWFSPGELRTAQADGRFRWGAVNWQLRSPAEYLKEHEDAVSEKQKALTAAQARVMKSATERPSMIEKREK